MENIFDLLSVRLVLGLVLVLDFGEEVGGLVAVVVVIWILSNILFDLRTIGVLHAVVPVVLMTGHVVLEFWIIFSIVLVTFEVELNLALTMVLLLVDERAALLRPNVFDQEVVDGRFLVVLSLITVNLVVRQFELMVPVHSQCQLLNNNKTLSSFKYIIQDIV